MNARITETLLAILILAGFVTANTVSADRFYRWVDADGVVHFSEVPPPEGTGEGVESRGRRRAMEAQPEPTTPGQPVAPLQPAPSAESAYTDSGETAGTGSPLLWRIEGAGSDPSYLLGTIHTEDPRALALPDSVNRALEAADTFAMEVLPDQNLFGGIAMAMLLTDGQDLRSLMGEPWYGQAVRGMAERGVPELAVARMKPWAVMTTLSTPPPRSGQVLDLVLLARAKARGKRLQGLETAEEQLSVFESIPLDDQVTMLKDTLRHLDEMPGMIDRMTAAYADGDLDRIVALAEESMTWGDPGIARRLEERLVRRRNLLMLDRMGPLLTRGNAFVAVGALHLPGAGGLLRLLTDQGYAVTRIEEP